MLHAGYLCAGHTVAALIIGGVVYMVMAQLQAIAIDDSNMTPTTFKRVAARVRQSSRPATTEQLQHLKDIGVLGPQSTRAKLITLATAIRVCEAAALPRAFVQGLQQQRTAMLASAVVDERDGAAAATSRRADAGVVVAQPLQPTGLVQVAGPSSHGPVQQAPPGSHPGGYNNRPEFQQTVPENLPPCTVPHEQLNVSRYGYVRTAQTRLHYDSLRAHTERLRQWSMQPIQLNRPANLFSPVEQQTWDTIEASVYRWVPMV